MIDLSMNNNPYYPSRNIKRTIKKSINKINKYPKKKDIEYKNTLSEVYKLNSNNCTICGGTLGIFNELLITLQIRKIGFILPTFWGMIEIAKENNIEIIYEYLDNNYEYNCQQIDNLARKVDALYLCNPNNPTLAYINNNKLESIISKNSDCHFIIDETLLYFDEEYTSKSMIKCVNKFKNISVFHSYSKIASVAGLRVSPVFSNVETIKKLEDRKIIYGTNILTEISIEEIISSIHKIDRKKFKQNFDYLIRKLNKEYIAKIIQKNSSFIIVKFNDNINVDELIYYLLKNDLKVVDISKSYVELEKNLMRISLGKKKDFRKLSERINKYLKENYEKSIDCYK